MLERIFHHCVPHGIPYSRYSLVTVTTKAAINNKPDTVDKQNLALISTMQQGTAWPTQRKCKRLTAAA